jgi:tetratricopeptide (TPR) repeat protein
MTLILGKTLSLASGREYVRSEDVYFYNRHIRRQLVSLVSTPLVFCLAFAGLVLSVRERRRFALLHAFVLAAWFMVFFATKTRYIMPFAPIAAIFAGYAVSLLVRAVREKRWRPASAVAALVGAAVVIWALNPLAVPRPDESEALFAIAERHRAYGHSRAAHAFYLKALELDPANPSIHLDLAVLYNQTGNRPAALRAVQLARELAPDAPETERAWYAISGEVPEQPLQ